MSILDSFEVIDRMMKVKQVRSAKELAECMDVEAGTLSKWKHRNSLPLEQIILFAERNNVSIDWLIFGKETEQLATDEQMMLLAYRQLEPVQKANLMMQMSGLSRGTGEKVVQSGDGGNNNQVFHGDVREVMGIKK